MATAIVEAMHERGEIDDTALICERHLCNVVGHNNLPSLQDLLQYAQKHGTDMIRESALHLSEAQHKILAGACDRIEAATKRARYS